MMTILITKSPEKLASISINWKSQNSKSGCCSPNKSLVNTTEVLWHPQLVLRGVRKSHGSNSSGNWKCFFEDDGGKNSFEPPPIIYWLLSQSNPTLGRWTVPILKRIPWKQNFEVIATLWQKGQKSWQKNWAKNFLLSLSFLIILQQTAPRWLTRF